jgi:hypothetical protein
MGEETLVQMRYLIKEGVKTLQYRSRLPKGDDSSTQYPGHWRWREWQDVPEVINENILKTGE